MSGFGPPRRTAGRSLLAMLLFVALAAALPTSSLGQALGDLDLGRSDAPVEIEASEGIEWHRDQRQYIARGNAKITRGDFVLYADVVTAHYREQEGSGSEISRVEAEGNVRVTTPSERVSGDRAVYDVEKGVVVMVGGDLRAETAEETLTATESLEYWESRQMVVARGDAVVTQGEKRLSADLLTGHFRRTPEGKQELARVEAVGNVELATESEFARGDRGTYNLETDIATLQGSVKITRGENQLNGEYAEVDFNTGVSRLLGNGGGESRVRTLIVPSSKPQPPNPEAVGQ